MSSKKKALITEITGQDGSYLAKFFLHKVDEVLGIVRRSSSFKRYHIDHYYQDLQKHQHPLFPSFWKLRAEIEFEFI